MAYCLKHDKFYATQGDYDAHFSRWRARREEMEIWNRGLEPGQPRLTLNARADLSDEEVAAAA